MRRALLLALAFAAGPAATAPGVVIYRCVAADGSVLIQNDAKCPKGMHEQKRVVARPAPAAPVVPPLVAVPAAGATSMIAGGPAATSPAGVGAAAPASGATATSGAAATAAAPGAADASGAPAAGASPTAPPAPRLPAPPIYACLTSDAQRYYADADRSTRCAPLAVVGLAGSGEGAAGEACEVVEDRCEAVPDDDRCSAWAERRRTAEHAQVFDPERADAARAELARVDATIAGTACAH